MKIPPQDATALAELRASLLHRSRPELTPEQGDEAFDHHMLLACAVYRAARLYRTGNGRDPWCKYIAAFFPEGRNSPEDAVRLWEDWRTALLKGNGPVVPITHGQSHLHWKREHGQPILNLEDVWDDFHFSVERFIEHLGQHRGDRAQALRRWRERSWTVRQLELDPEPADLWNFGRVSASVAASATAFAPQPGQRFES